MIKRSLEQPLQTQLGNILFAVRSSVNCHFTMTATPGEVARSHLLDSFSDDADYFLVQLYNVLVDLFLFIRRKPFIV